MGYDLFIDEILHGVVALPFAVFIFYKTKNWKLPLITLFAIYAIDTDHILDFWRFRAFSIDVGLFFQLDYFDQTGKALVLFHAWEWLLIMAYFSIKKGWNHWLTAVSLGIFAHLLWDSHTVGSIMFYSFIYRASTGFSIPF